MRKHVNTDTPGTERVRHKYFSPGMADDLTTVLAVLAVSVGRI
jgi:hypothetical protein